MHPCIGGWITVHEGVLGILWMNRIGSMNHSSWAQQVTPFTVCSQMLLGPAELPACPGVLHFEHNTDHYHVMLCLMVD